jgi:hypothetical protein
LTIINGFGGRIGSEWQSIIMVIWFDYPLADWQQKENSCK